MAELIGLVVVVLLLAWSVVAYNGLLAGRNRVRKARARLEAHLRRRRDVALALCDAVLANGDDPQVVETVQRVRTAALAERRGAADPGRRETELSDALAALRAAADRCAEREANEAIRDLRAELDATEDRIAAAQQVYNDTVTGYDARRRRPGSNLVAGIGHFESVNRFEARTDSRTRP